MRPLSTAVLLLLSGSAAAGCAAHDPSLPLQRQSVHAAIAAAEAMGAGLQGEAASCLARAQAQAALGERLLAHGSVAHGRRLLHRAEADAALAWTLARQLPAQALAQDAVDQLRAFEAASTEAP